MTALDVGVTLSEIEPEEVAALEALGVDSLWVGGHVMWPVPTNEPLAQLALLAASSSVCRIGTSVLQLPLYQPAIVAKQVATIDRFSRGRVVLGIGVAGENPVEFEACQVPIEERGARADEALQVLRLLWSEPTVDHAGVHYPMTGASIDPPPHQPGGPRLVVAGRKAPAMRRAALRGDGWMPYLYSAERYAAAKQEIEATAAAHGRELGAFLWSAYVFIEIDDDPEEARVRLAARLGRSYGQDFTDFVDRVAVAGDVPHAVARVQQLVDAGARQFVFGAPPDGRLELARRIVQDVMPDIRLPAHTEATARG